MKISGRTFIVSGGASGLGLATTEKLVSLGAHVAVFDRDADAGKSVEGLESVRYFVADVTDEEAVDSAIEQVDRWTETTKRPLAGVLNTAGVSWAARTVDRAGVAGPVDVFRTVTEINLIGSYSLSSKVAAKLARMPESLLDEDGERGVIILVASVAAFEGQVGQAAYAASKGGVASLVLPMARDLAPWGIRVVGIAPGVFETSMTAPMPPKTKQKLTAMLEFPRRFGKPDEFATMVVEVVGNTILNGTVIRLDGATRLGKL